MPRRNGGSSSLRSTPNVETLGRRSGGLFFISPQLVSASSPICMPNRRVIISLSGGTEPMFTLGACFFVALLAWLAHRSNEKHRREYHVPDDRHEWLLLLHIREDLKLQPVVDYAGAYLAILRPVLRGGSRRISPCCARPMPMCWSSPKIRISLFVTTPLPR